jgi:pSer/pThr/pTyr-binding forkhead associated (FHA) protein
MLLVLGDSGPRSSEGDGYRVCADERHVLLGEGEVVIGRSSYCSLVLDHETLSRVHASLRAVGNGIELTDLGSSNGTFVNGAAVKGSTRVAPGDDIRLGKVKIWIEIASARISAQTGRFPLRIETERDASPDEKTTVANLKMGEPK